MHPTHPDSVKDFFNQISLEYDDSIRRTCPPYAEMFQALFTYLFMDTGRDLSILELGCGTGNLTQQLATVFPKSRLTVVDLSPEMLEQTKQKLHNLPNPLETVNGSFMDLDLPENHFDLIISSIALHHLSDEEKPAMYQHIYRWLKPGGKFRCADGCRFLPAEPIHTAVLERWWAWSKELGAKEEEVSAWKEHHFAYDHLSSVPEHLDWLKEAGFQYIDCYWRNFLWAVFGGEKAA